MAKINNRRELIEEYMKFFKNHEEYPHKEIPNASLIPNLETYDTGVLFTTAGMHPLVPYLLGQKHPEGKRLCNVQKCIRTQDIEEVGDTTHHTFFEMLGNWSLGNYWKKEAIEMSYEFLTKVLEIPHEKLAVTCFAGDEENNIPKDTESARIWESIGIPEERIAFTKKDNWWGPAGKTGPCGPDTEIFYSKSKASSPEKFDPEDEENWVEIWNNVLMQYNKQGAEGEDNFNEAEQKNIDTGMGVERTVAILNGLEDDYLTGSFLPIIKKIEELSGKKYEKVAGNRGIQKIMRIISDHIKASVMILSEGVKPSNTEQGYILRRLIRRGINYGRKIGLSDFTPNVAGPVFDIYTDYTLLQKNKENILKELEKEEKKFNEKINQGIKVFEKIVKKLENSEDKDRDKKKISGKDAFLLYQSYGFPIEMTIELAKEKNLKVDKKSFDNEYKKHQELSRTASAGKFKSGLSDDSESTTRLHTATHMLNEALRQVLNDRNIQQKGSNINPERLRFDFNFPRKLTKEELQKVEDLVNEKIQEELPITYKEMSVEEAKSLNAEGIFDEKYKDKVRVYFIGPKETWKKEEKEKPFSVEICAGPHVKNTKELGNFKIKKEESSSAGVRRIKATLEDSDKN